MAVNAGILKAVVSFYRIDSETAFERHVSRIPIKCKRRMDADKAPYFIPWLMELSSKYGLGDFYVKLYPMAPKSGGTSNNFALTTNEQWNRELPTILAGTGSELNSMFWNGWVFGIDINVSVKACSVV